MRLGREAVVRLWLDRQGLLRPRGRRLTRKAFAGHLDRAGGLQLDSVNVVERAHYLTLWSRFGGYSKATLDRFSHRSGLSYEQWGHEACLLPMSRLPLSRRGMSEFAPRERWWRKIGEAKAVHRRVLAHLRQNGPTESAEFPAKAGDREAWPEKPEKMALLYLWHAGKVATCERRHFRRVYDLAERVFPPGPTASREEYEDGWLLTGLSGNGAAPESHLMGYITAPRLKAADRREVIRRNLERGRIVEVSVEDQTGAWYARPEDLEGIGRLPPPRGTNLLCPFDSLLWQRRRAEDLLGFTYRIEIYVPAAKRRYGYYALPILHRGRLVGRIDPKLDRKAGRLIVHSIHLEPDFTADAPFRAGLAKALTDLGDWLGADDLALPKGWRNLV